VIEITIFFIEVTFAGLFVIREADVENYVDYIAQLEKMSKKRFVSRLLTASIPTC